MHFKKIILAAIVITAFNSFGYGQQNESYGRFVYAIQNNNNFNINVTETLTASAWSYWQGWNYRSGDGNIGTSQSGTINGNGHTLNMNGFYGFLLSGGRELSINNLTISGSVKSTSDYYGSVFYINAAKLNLTDVTLTGNKVRNDSGDSPRSAYGGTLALLNSTFTVSGDISFRNSAVEAVHNSGSRNRIHDARGGAIYSQSSNLDFSGAKNVVFQDNYADTSYGNNSYSRYNYGGAIYAYNSIVSFNGTDSVLFSGNYLMGSSGGNTSGQLFAGGAIYLENSSLDFRNTVLTSSNNYSGAASNHNSRGGFLYSKGSSLYFGEATFINNRVTGGTSGSKQGGAIYIEGGGANFTGNTYFISNSATTGEGGALYVTGSSVTFSGAHTEFSNNTSTTGAILAGSYSNVVFKSENTHFNYNESYNGNGIISIGSYLTLDLSSTNITAVGNKSASGGFLFLDGNSIDFGKDVTFESNEATNLYGNGGAFQLSGGSSLEFKGASNIFRGNKVNGRGSGGAIYVSGSTVSFSGKLTQFESNNVAAASTGGGGALYITGTSSVTFSSADTEFTGNYTTGSNKNGGAIFLEGESSLSFGKLEAVSNVATGYGGFLYASIGRDIAFNGSVEITSNAANLGGAVYLTGNRNISFTGANAEFKYNKAGSGGAFYLTGASGSALTFDTALTATGNNATSGTGGFMYIQSSTAVFKNNSTVSGNQASSAGGAIYSSGANIAFSGTDTNFTSNFSSGTGGAVYAAASSKLDFTGTALKAESNSANSGGFLMLNNSTVDFGKVEMNYNQTRQAGGTGGALGMLSSAIANFNGLLTSFTENFSRGSGGAISMDDSTSNFNNSGTVFSRNRTDSSGGAVYLSSRSKLVFSASAAGSEFLNNQAASNGGAVAVTGGSTAEFYNAVFKGNQAVSGVGGAVSIEGSYVNISSVSFISENVSGSSVTLFSGNTASGLSNAIHLGNNSNTYFRAGSSSSIEMHDGMSGGTGNNINMYFSGEGNFNLYADAVISNVNVKVSGIEGGTFNLYNGANFTAKTLTNDEGSVIKMNSDDKNTITLSEFINNGELEMTTALYEGEDNTDSDQILVSGDVTLGSESILKVTLKHNRFIEKEFKLIQYGNILYGEFGDVIYDERVVLATATIDYGSRYNDWITVAMRGKGKGTSFSEIDGLSRNQYAAAVTYDTLSLISEDNTDLDDVITAIDSLNNDAEIKDALNQASGYFLANVIRSAAFGGDSNEVYNRILDASQYDFANSGLWAQAKANSVTNKADENSPEDYNDTIIGMMIGYDRFFSGNSLMFGVYGKFDMHNIKQDPGNTADITSAGLGLYGGYIKEKWELKGLLSGNFDSYSTEREITFLPVEDRKAEADFGGTTIGFDLEGAYKIDVNDDIQFRPYAGFEVKSVNYDEIKEKGAQSLNIISESGNYGRMSARFGAGINRKHNVYGWYINGEYKQLLSGELPEIDNTFEGTDNKFTIVGSEEGQGALGVKAGGSYNIAENLMIYANISYFTAERYDNIYGNLGVRWLMFSGTDEKTEHIKKDKDIAGSLAQKQEKRQGKIEAAEDALMDEEEKLEQLKASLAEKKRLEKDMQEEAKFAVREAQRAEDVFYSLTDLTLEEQADEEKKMKGKLKQEKDAVKAFNSAEKDVKKTEKEIEKQTEKVRKAEARLSMINLQAQEEEKQDLEKRVKSEYVRYEKETVIDEKAAEREAERELKKLQREEERIRKDEMKLAQMQAKKAADEEKRRQKSIAAEQASIEAGLISDLSKDEAKIAKEQASRERAAMKELEKAEKELLKEEKLIEKEREKMRKEEERLIALQVKMLEDDARKKEQAVKSEAKKKKPVPEETEEKAKQQQKIEAEIAAYEASLAAEKVQDEQKAAKESAVKKKAEEEKKRQEQERIQKEKAEAKMRQPGELSDADLDKRAKEAAARRFKKVQKAFDLKFTPNNYKLVETAKITIREQAEEIKKMKYEKVIIEGHTDSEEAGSYEASKDLSRMRAEAVYNEFVANGIPKDKIDFAGLADKFSIGDNKTDRGKIDNRRVEVVVE